MNTLSIAVLSLLFLTALQSTSAAEDATPVLDTDGNELKPGSEYYIMPVFHGLGGGVTLSPYPTGKHEQCPAIVSLDPFHFQKGLPVSFHPADPSFDIVPLSKSLNIKFQGLRLPSCATSTVWQVGDSVPNTEERMIKIGGVEGSPGCSNADSWFKIEEVVGSYYYKLAWNPVDVCRFNVMGWEKYEVTLGAVGGHRALVLSKDNERQAFPVVFVKKEEGF